MNALAGKPIGPIDLLIGYEPDRIAEMVAAYGPEGRAVYALGEMTADVAYPIIYTTLFCIVLTLLFRNRPYAPFPLVNVLPVAGLIIDFLENACIIYLLKTYPNSSGLIISLCSILTNLKWGISFAIIALVVYGLVQLAFGGRQKRVI